jgi:hypothetical protein
MLFVATRATANPLTITRSIHLAEEYNDNVFFERNKTDDYITRLGVGLNLTYQTPSSTTNVSTGIGASYFARGSDTTIDLAQAQRLSYSSIYQYSPRLSFSINDSLARVGRARDLGFVNTATTTGATTDTTINDPSNTNTNDVNVVLPRGSALSNSFGVAASYLLSPLWTGTVSYANGVSNFTDPGSTDLTHRVGLQLLYRWSEPLSLTADYDYSRFNSGNGPDSEGHTATIGPIYKFSDRWWAFGNAGGSILTPIGSSNTSTRTGFAFSAGVNGIFEKSNLSLGANQGLTPSAGVAGASETLGGYLSYYRQLGEHLRGTLYTSYSKFDTSTTNFNVYQLRLALVYPVWRRFDVALAYGFTRRDSHQSSNTIESGVVDGNSVRLQISTTFDPWQLDV